MGNGGNDLLKYLQTYMDVPYLFSLSCLSCLVFKE